MNMKAIILSLLVYIAVGDGQGSDYDQELENILTEIEEREGFFNTVKTNLGFSAPETTPINTMTKGISKADCEIQLKDYCDKLQLECLHADVVYIYGGEKHAGNCFLHFEEELHGLQAKNIKQVMKNVEKTELSSNSKKKYVSTALDREVVAFATQKDATWGLSRIGNVSRPTNSAFSKYSFEHENYGEGVRVFVMDSGIDEKWVKKKEFAGRVEAGADFTDAGVGVKDENEHGTHCAGTVLGKKHGVAKKATLVPVKVLSGDEYGPATGSWSRIIKGMQWIQKQCEEGAPCVASASFGSPKNPQANTAVNSLVDSGVVFVAAAGNENADACNFSPGGAEKAITVGAVDHNLRRSSFSNHGKCVDIWAPGRHVLSTILRGKTGYDSGTSMAAPHVSGVVAAYISQSGETDPTIIKEKLLRDAAEDVIKDANSAKSRFVQLTPQPKKYTRTKGNCRGGVKYPGLNKNKKCIGTPTITNAQCQEYCDNDENCKAYGRKKSETSKCCLFSTGHTGNGRSGRECYVSNRNHAIWKIGRKGEVCDDVCGDLICDSEAQTALTTKQLVSEAFREAGYECNGFHGAREYEGSPFATERNGEDCAPFDAESNEISSCSENSHSNHRPLCRCKTKSGQSTNMT